MEMRRQLTDAYETALVTGDHVFVSLRDCFRCDRTRPRYTLRGRYFRECSRTLMFHVPSRYTRGPNMQQEGADNKNTRERK